MPMVDANGLENTASLYLPCSRSWASLPLQHANLVLLNLVRGVDYFIVSLKE